MGILLKNAQAESMARELAELRGSTLTEAIRSALESALAEERARRGSRPTFDEMMEATRRLHARADARSTPLPPMTKKDWDDLWPTGVSEIDDA